MEQILTSSLARTLHAPRPRRAPRARIGGGVASTGSPQATDAPSGPPQVEPTLAVGEHTERAELKNASQPRHESYLRPSVQCGKCEVRMSCWVTSQSASIVQKKCPEADPKRRLACVSFAPIPSPAHASAASSSGADF